MPVVGMKVELYERILKIKRPKSLENHKLQCDLVLIFCILANKFDLPFSDSFSRPEIDNLRGHRTKFYYRRFCLKHRDVDFFGSDCIKL